MKKLYITVLLICTGILIVSGYKLMSFYKEDQKYIEEFSKLSEIAEKNITQKSKEYKTEELPFYSDLYNQNKDFAGWISIKDTTIKTNASGANAVFATGENAVINVSNKLPQLEIHHVV